VATRVRGSLTVGKDLSATMLRRLATPALAVIAGALFVAPAAAQYCDNLTASVIEKPRLFVGVLDKPPGAHKLAFSGTAPIPTVPAIDLVASGARVVVDDAQGDVLLDATIPPGAWDATLKRGWRANGRGGFFYKNNGAPLNGGVFSITVNELRAAPGSFQFRVKAKSGAYPVVASDLPLRVTLVLDPPTAAGTGQCTEAQYADECRFNKSFSTLRCKPAV
jgi:hypothetical protein